MMRATGSVEPPGGKGTMILIGPLGQSPCARLMAGVPDRGRRGADQQRTALKRRHKIPP
jgi:hypothetical protein